MYTLKILNDAEFDMLPYKHVRESLGCANPKTKTAYVRKTGVKPLDMFVTQHELDELIAKVSPHEEDGIRYKKGSTIIKDYVAPIALGFVPGVGPLLSGLYTGINSYQTSGNLGQSIGMGALSGLGSSLTQGTSGYASGVAASKAAGGGWLGQALSGAKGVGSSLVQGAKNLLGFGTNVASNAPAIAGGANSLGAAASQSAGANLAPLVGPVTQAQSQLGYNYLSQVPKDLVGSVAAQNAVNATTTSKLMGEKPLTNYTQQLGLTPQTTLPTTPAASTTLQVPGLKETLATSQTANPALGPGMQAPQSMLGKILSKAGEYVSSTEGVRSLVGGAIPLLGGGLGPKVQDFSAFDSAAYQQLSDKVKLGQVTPLSAEQKSYIESQYNTQYDTARKNLEQRYKALRPGSDVATDSDFSQAIQELETEFATAKSNAIVGATWQLNEQQSEMLSQMAEMDIYTLATQAGISVQEAQQFQDMLSQMGYMVSGQGANNNDLLSKIFGK